MSTSCGTVSRQISEICGQSSKKRVQNGHSQNLVLDPRKYARAWLENYSSEPSRRPRPTNTGKNKSGDIVKLRREYREFLASVNHTQTDEDVCNRLVPGK